MEDSAIPRKLIEGEVCKYGNSLKMSIITSVCLAPLRIVPSNSSNDGRESCLMAATCDLFRVSSFRLSIA